MDELPQFSMPGSACDISDLLISSGFPHLTVTENNRSMAYECCLVYEIITKRVAALDDIRKGLGSVAVRNKTCLCLLEKWPVLKTRYDDRKSGCYLFSICILKLKYKFSFVRFFPPPQDEVIDLATLSPHIHYEVDETDERKKEAQTYFEKYLLQISERGCILTLVSACSLLMILHNIT